MMNFDRIGRVRSRWAVAALAIFASSSLLGVSGISQASASVAALSSFTVTGHVDLGAVGTSAGAGDVTIALEQIDSDGPWNPSSPAPAVGPDVTTTDESGNYSITVPTFSGSVEWGIVFYYTGQSSTHYLPSWWTSFSGNGVQDNGAYPGQATPIFLPAATATVANMVMPIAGNLSGIVTTSSGGVPASPAYIQFKAQRIMEDPGLVIDPFYPYVDEVNVQGKLASDGSYSLAGIMPGTYEVSFQVIQTEGPYYATAYAGSTKSEPAADVLETVGEGQSVTNANAVVFLRASVTGTISCMSCSAAIKDNEEVALYRQVDAGAGWQWVPYRGAPTLGMYPGYPLDGTGFVPGTYRLQVSIAGQPQFGWAESAPFVLTEGSTATLSLAINKPPSTRLDGSNRFETAVDISHNNLEPAEDFAPGVAAVYIVDGVNYSDAMSAGPSASAHGGPILLVKATSIPAAVEKELKRLEPKSIVVVGPTSSVSDGVMKKLREYVAQSTDVVRVGGMTPDSTSLALADYSFPQGATSAVIASGTNFAEEVAAGAAAAKVGGPLITVNGSASTPDSATLATLADLGVRSVVVVGGTSSVSAGFSAALENIPGLTVTRVADDTPYETSEELNALEFLPQDGAEQPTYTTQVAFLAPKANDGDALSAGALAGRLGAPIFVVPEHCIPEDTEIALQNLQIDRLVVLGSTSSLSRAVSSFAECS